MGVCAICGKDKKLTDHHYWWPRRKYRRKGKQKFKVCKDCHNEGPGNYHDFYLAVCRGRIPCFGCRFAIICCYAKGVT